MQARGWKHWLIFGLGAVIAVRSGMEVVRLYRTGDKVDEVKQELERVEKEHQELEAKLAEVQTLEFVEKEARERLGLGKPGEVMLILPEQDQVTSNQLPVTSKDKANWEKWWEMYVGC